MTDRQQPRTAEMKPVRTMTIAQSQWQSNPGHGHWPITPVDETLWLRIFEVNADLGAQIAALRDTVADIKRFTTEFYAEFERLNRFVGEAKAVTNLAEQLEIVKERIRALESPASAPECGCNNECDGSCEKYENAMFERIYGGEAYAPEPDPLCAREWCGHPKSEHGGGEANCYHMDMPTMSCVLKCACERFVPQASPATAHQEPPDAVLVDDVMELVRSYAKLKSDLEVWSCINNGPWSVADEQRLDERWKAIRARLEAGAR